MVLSHDEQKRYVCYPKACVLTTVKISDLSPVRRSQESGRTWLLVDAQESGPEQERE